jgi:hypothetical protein
VRSLVLVALAVAVAACGGKATLASSPEGGMDAAPEAGGAGDAAEELPEYDSGAGFSCDECGDESLVCDVEAGTCVQCVIANNCTYLGPGLICLPDHSCGCNADTQCAGQVEGTRCVASQCGCETSADCPLAIDGTCAPNHRCGCGSNADCAAPDGGVPALDEGVCDTATGLCVQCVTDADCTDPNNKVCDPSTHLCLPCRVDADCVNNTDGPICGDLGQYSLGYGMCGCLVDTDCSGHAGGPDCVSNGSPYDKCGCQTAADCASDTDGHACVNPYSDGWMQCGCQTTGDCPAGKSCEDLLCQ